MLDQFSTPLPLFKAHALPAVPANIRVRFPRRIESGPWYSNRQPAGSCLFREALEAERGKRVRPCNYRLSGDGLAPSAAVSRWLPRHQTWTFCRSRIV